MICPDLDDLIGNSMKGPLLGYICYRALVQGETVISVYIVVKYTGDSASCGMEAPPLDR